MIIQLHCVALCNCSVLGVKINFKIKCWVYETSGKKQFLRASADQQYKTTSKYLTADEEKQ